MHTVHPEDVSASLWIGGIAFALSVLAVMCSVVALSARADTSYESVSKCVISAARQHHHPDPYGPQAWKLFVGSCH